MKQQNGFKRIFAVLLAFCLFCLSVFSNAPALAQEGAGYDAMTPEEKQSYLEMKLQQTEEKLENLSKQSADTKAYLDALDEKIAYLREQLNIVKNKVSDSEDRIISLNKQHQKNQEDIAEIGVQIDALGVQIDELSVQFNQNYDAYCKRLCAMYVSGNTNVLSFLLTSEDISQLLTRYEMIRRVAEQDSALLKSIQEEGTQVQNAKTDLAQKQEVLSEKQLQLVKTETELAQTIKQLEQDKKDLENKENLLAAQQQDANALLKQLTDQTKEYTEYRDTTKNDLEEIDRQIEQAAQQYITTTTTTTTKKETTKKPLPGESTTQTTTTKKTTVSNNLSLTYPVPSQTRITTSFHGYAGHTGCDFACDSGSKVVAAESGTVIVSTDLLDDDGNYRSYGRYILIAHDKRDASGNAVYTLYAHNSRRVVSAGDYVKKGQLIAYSGSTGNSTGPHCHFEVRTPSYSYNDCVDPERYLP